MVTVVLSLFLLVASPAQNTPTPAQNPADLCTVQGVVVRAGTGEPLRKAEVWIGSVDGRNPGGDAATDAMGRFEIKGLNPGRYYLSVQRNGYVRQRYGQHRSGGAGAILALSPGQQMSGIRVQLDPAAAISGHVYDEEGEPATNAEVHVLRRGYEDGSRQFVHAGQAQTNDLGEFRVYGLEAGQYIVQADYRAHQFPVPKAEQGYLPVYYPGVSDPGAASVITLRAGGDFSGVDVNLRTSHTVTIRGRVINGFKGEAGPRAQLRLNPRGPNSVGIGAVAFAYVTDPQGDFSFVGVTPGSYYVYAHLSDGEAHYEARQPLEVADSDIEGVTLTLTPGIDIRGRISVEGRSDVNLSGVSIGLSPGENGMFYINMPSGTINPDGTLLIKNVFDGTYRVDVYGLPENSFLKSARLGGIDVLSVGLTIDTKQTPGLLEILVSPNGAALDGVVSIDQQPFPGAAVALVPDPPHRGERRLFRSTSTDQLGRFFLEGIPPGDYKVFAWESIEPGAYTSAEFLQPFENRGESVHFTEGSRQTVKLDLIPKAAE